MLMFLLLAITWTLVEVKLDFKKNYLNDADLRHNDTITMSKVK
jgi:hypothetical protein